MRKRKFRLWICVTALCCCAAAMLLGCSGTGEGPTDVPKTEEVVGSEKFKGSETVVDEAKMMADLAARGFPEGEDHPEIQSLEILKRKTDEEAGTDLIYVTVQAESETIRHVRSYGLQYEMFNDGWSLEAVDHYEVGQNEYFPLTGPSDLLIDQMMEEFNSTAGVAKKHDNSGHWHVRGAKYVNWDIIDQTVDLENKTATCCVQAARDQDNGWWNGIEILTLSFTFYEDWYPDVSVEDAPSELAGVDMSPLEAVIGTEWIATEDNNSYLVITEVGDETLTLECQAGEYYFSGVFEYAPEYDTLSMSTYSITYIKQVTCWISTSEGDTYELIFPGRGDIIDGYTHLAHLRRLGYKFKNN